MPHVERDETRIHYETAGTGPPVVLLHSFLCSGTMWKGQVDALAGGHRIINVDARGHGGSAPVRRSFSLYDAMHDVIAVLDTEGIERCVWAGLSMGGMAALRAALREPQRVSGLLLLDTSAGVDRWAARLRYAMLGTAARVVGLRRLIPPVARQMFGDTTRRMRPDLVGRWAEEFVTIDVPSALLTLRALNQRDDLEPVLGRISVPAAVIVGAEDRSLSPRVSRRLADGLPHSTFQEIPHTGHLSAMENPEAVTEAMLEFLESAYRQEGRGRNQ